jgi:undecaprenyl-diphosphooligosaccharide---protein glycotransferase
MQLFTEFKNNSWLFIGALLACFVVSAAVRYQQFEKWKETPAAYFAGERPMMTTLDAPYWLRLAREYNEKSYGLKQGIRNYPESTDTIRKMSVNKSNRPLKYNDPNHYSSNYSSFYGTKEVSYRDIPLLSFLIAHIVPFFSYNYYLAGTLLLPLLASLFILPMGYYFFRIGIPLSGLLGGLIGTFAGGYFMRSSIGRIDTDMLNLFFPAMTGLLILLAGKAKTERNVLLYSLGTGLSLFLFQWWYQKTGFTLVYFAVFVFSLFVQRVRFQTILLSSLLFVLCSQPTAFLSGIGGILEFLENYFTIEDSREGLIDNSTTPATFPNTMTTISEVDHVSMSEVLRRVLANTTLNWIGLLGIFGLAVYKWRVLLPLTPMLALGLLSFQSSNRFIMYLAPFIGIGLGWLLNICIDYVFLWTQRNSSKNLAPHLNKLKKNVLNDEQSDVLGAGWLRQGALYLGMGIFFWFIAGQTAISFVPGPSIHTGLYATFLEVKKRVPENSALLTWWDYGYAISDATRLATFHDGGNQTTPKTFFIARGLISADPDELYDITQYLATEGNSGISENNTSPDALLAAVRNPQKKPWDPIYLFFTADMTGKYGAISKLGSWDIVKGGSKPRGYQNLSCNKITNEELNCRGAKIDLKAGKINNQVPLKRIVFIRDGKVMREQEFGHPQGYTLQLLVAGQQIVEVQLIDEVVFRSNYNQMHLLGRYDDELFEETYNAFPFSRLFRVKF